MFPDLHQQVGPPASPHPSLSPRQPAVCGWRWPQGKSALALYLPTVLNTVQQKKSALKKDQSLGSLNHSGFTFCRCSRRFFFLPSTTQERDHSETGLCPATQTHPGDRDRVFPKAQPLPALWSPSTPWLGPGAFFYDASVAQVLPLVPGV
jgi:hypothetical protein